MDIVALISSTGVSWSGNNRSHMAPCQHQVSACRDCCDTICCSQASWDDTACSGKSWHLPACQLHCQYTFIMPSLHDSAYLGKSHILDVGVRPPANDTPKDISHQPHKPPFRTEALRTLSPIRPRQPQTSRGIRYTPVRRGKHINHHK